MKNILLGALAVIAFFSLYGMWNWGTFFPAQAQTVNDFATVTNSSTTVGTASTTVLSANTGRKYAAIINDSTSTIYCALGNNAFNRTGIRLNANGGSYEIGRENYYVGEVTCKATSANLNVTTVEGQ